MKEIELTTKLIEELIKSPETGMGYHTVNILLTNGNKLEKQVVLNSSILVTNENITINDISEVEVC